LGHPPFVDAACPSYVAFSIDVSFAQQQQTQLLHPDKRQHSFTQISDNTGMVLFCRNISVALNTSEKKAVILFNGAINIIQGTSNPGRETSTSLLAHTYALSHSSCVFESSIDPGNLSRSELFSVLLMRYSPLFNAHSCIGNIQATAGDPVSLLAISIYGSHGFDFVHLSKPVANSSPKHFTRYNRTYRVMANPS
jgi:hypothetical protein